MNFLEAVKAMKEGKKVRRPIFNKDIYFYSDNPDTAIMHCDGNQLTISVNFIEATDWEIYEEPKKYMVCKKCGEIGDTWTAYCCKCGRSVHTIKEFKKTLSSEIYNSEEQYLRQGGKSDELIVLSIVKFRQKVKEFIDICSKNSAQEFWMNEKAKEIFGNRLI